MALPTRKPVVIGKATMESPGTGVRGSKFKETAANEGRQMYALGIATVIQIDHALHLVTLRTENGETFENMTMVTYPGGGARQFLGAVPSVGDVCVIGWGAAESGRTRQPYILSWFVSPTAGYDGWIMQPFGQDEFDLTPKDRETFEGLANRTRYKMRHMLPGNVAGSSAQGSDLVLDESVTLSNRRGNELILRDQDQSLVVRTIQQFHVGGGFRVYSGIIQRDARMLPPTMVSDGVAWASSLQQDSEGNPLTETDLDDLDVPDGYITPHRVFQRSTDGNRVAVFTDDNGNPTFPFSTEEDPYAFLQKGLFVDLSGRYLGDDPDAVYGGKAVYRVSKEGINATNNTQAQALTEYRIELAHTSDGTLPVSEQTDGFDADRLPSAVPTGTSSTARSPSSPFIEFVLGTVVGNDPFSVAGKKQYGLPLSPSDDGELKAAVGGESGKNAAYMLRVMNPDDLEQIPTFNSITKDGRLFSYYGGPDGVPSAEVNYAHGIVFRAGGDCVVGLDGSLSLTSTGGTVINGGPSSFNVEGFDVQSSKDASLIALRDVSVSGASVSVANTNVFTVAVSSLINLQSGDRYSQSSITRDVTVLGKSVETYSGPKNGLATFGPAREISIATSPATGHVGGTADKYDLNYGDRVETIRAGNHETTILVGDATYQVVQGKWTAKSGVNSIEIDGSGVSLTANTGVMKMTALAGSTSITGSTSVTVTSTGPVRISGSSIVLVAPGTSTGGIVCGSDLDPVSGAPLATLGLGSLTHTLSPS